MTLPCSCFTPEYIFLLTEVVSLDAAGAVSGRVALGQVSTLPISPRAGSPGHDLTWTGGIVGPLFPRFLFCPSSVEVLPTCCLSACRPWKERGVCSSSTRHLTGFRCRRRHSVARSVVTAFFFCSVENAICWNGFAGCSCPTDYLQGFSWISCPGLLIFL